MSDFDGLPLFNQGSDQAHGGALWLACDPRAAGWQPGQDLGPYLVRAAALFSAKAWTGGAAPAVIRAHPTDAGNGTGTAARALGLQVIADPKVGRGCFWLGMKGGD